MAIKQGQDFVDSNYDASTNNLLPSWYVNGRQAWIKELFEDPEVNANLALLADRARERIRAAFLTPPVEPEYSSVYDFVDGFLAPMYATSPDRLDDRSWTRMWWTHPEIVVRFTALWRRYEYLRVAEPVTGVETFLRSYGDYHMRQVMSKEGVLDDSKRTNQPSIPLDTAPLDRTDVPLEEAATLEMMPIRIEGQESM